MPPPSPSFPLSDSRSLRLPPPSSLYTSIPPPSPSIYSPGPLPSPRYLDGYPSEHKYFGPYAGMPLTVTPPQTPGIYPPSPNSMHRKLPSPFSVPSLISDRSQLDSLSDASSSSAESTPHGSPKFERKNYWGAYSPPTSENESRSSSVSSFSDSHDEAKEEEAKCEKQQQQQQEEQQQVTGNKRRRSMESEEEVEEVGISKRRRESSDSSHRRSSSASSSANSSDNDDEKEEYDVLGRKKPKAPRTPVSWDPEDDQRLIHLKEVQRLGWKQISTYFKKRTSHACQFRWRRLTSGTLKYYQGQRRPPMIPTNTIPGPMTPPEYASPSPKPLMARHSISTVSPMSTPVLPAQHPHSHSHSHTHAHPHRNSIQLPVTPPATTRDVGYFPPQATAGESTAPTTGYASTEPATTSKPWDQQEDALLLDKKLSFAEVNVLLAHRSEREIWERMGELRYGVSGR